MEIQHKSHHHPLHLLDQRNWKGLHCAGCPSDLSYPTFGCEQCNFFLHMSCLGLPEKVEHRLHPNHPLELRLISSFAEYDYVSFCNLCFGPIAGPGCFYSCVLSGEEFKMHAGCALREPSLSHPYHKHPLVVVEKKHATSTKNNTENCAACGTAVGQNKDGEVFYCCLECKVFFHKGCFDMPPRIKRDRHPHPLTLYLDPIPDDYDESVTDYYCDECEEKRYVRGFSYACKDCDYFCHLQCPTEILGEVGEGPEAEEEDREDSFGERSSRTAENKRGD